MMMKQKKKTLKENPTIFHYRNGCETSRLSLSETKQLSPRGTRFIFAQPRHFPSLLFMQREFLPEKMILSRHHVGYFQRITLYTLTTKLQVLSFTLRPKQNRYFKEIFYRSICYFLLLELRAKLISHSNNLRSKVIRHFSISGRQS